MSFNVGSSGGAGEIEITNGGELTLNQYSLGGEAASPVYFALGDNNGFGNMVVTDDARASISTNNSEIIFGIGSAGGVGQLEVLRGGNLELTQQSEVGSEASRIYFAVGNNDSTGQMDIANNGRVNLSTNNSDTQFLVGGANANGDLNIFDGGELNLNHQSVGGDTTSQNYFFVGSDGTGSMSVSSGGKVTLSSDVHALMVIGHDHDENTDYQSSLTLDGAGSEIFVSAGTGFTRLAIGQGNDGIATLTNGAKINVVAEDDNYSSFVVGDRAHGSLNVLSGSQVIVDGLGNHVYASFATQAEGEADVTVSGVGSLFAVGGFTPSGTGSYINVSAQDHQGPGILTVEDGAEIRTDGVLIGKNASFFGETGTLNADLVRIEGGTLGKAGTVGNFDMNANLQMNNGFIFDVDIVGPAVSVLDFTDVDGSANLSNGIVRFDFGAGFSINAGENFTFLQATSGVDANANSISYSVSGLASNFQSALVFSANSISLNALSNGIAEANVDVLFGSAANDNYDAGDGNDILNGGGGTNLLAGGAGSDTFIFNEVGQTTIRDFAAGAGSEDQLDLTFFGLAGLADVLANATENGSGNVEIAFGSSGVVELDGVALAALHQDDFVL